MLIKDIIEILTLSTAIYYFLVWLKQDQTKNLTLYVYSYMTIFTCAYYFDLTILYNIMLITSPFIGMFFIIIHQNTLQKNFIALQKTNHKTLGDIWINDLVAGLLLTISKNKTITCVLEKSESLNTFIQAPYKLHADINKDFFEIILDKQVDSNNSFIWLNCSGKLVAFNCLWEFDIDTNIVKDFSADQKWKLDAIFITNKTDSCVIKSNYDKRSFDCIINGKLSNNLTGNQLLTVLKDYLLPDDIITSGKQNPGFAKATPDTFRNN